MAQDTIDKIINIRFRYSELLDGLNRTDQAITQVKQEMSTFKADIKEFHKDLKSGAISQEEYNRKMADYGRTLQEDEQRLKALSDQRRQYSKELQNNIKIETKAVGSIDQLRANVSKLTAQYNALAASEREGSFGKRLAADIKSQQTAIVEAEKSLGNYRSQVGSYEEALRAVLPAEASQLVTLGKTIEKSGGVTKAFGLLTAAVGRMAKAVWAFISTPLGAILTASSVAVALVVKNWDKLTDSLGLTSPAKEAARAIEGLNKQLDYLGNKAEKNGTEALKRYTEALKNAKGDAEALAKAQGEYNAELQNTELNRASKALQETYKAEDIAFRAYQRAAKNASGLFGSKEVEKEALEAFNEAKKLREKAQADLAKADNDRTKTHAEELAKQVESEKKAAQSRIDVSNRAATEEYKAIMGNATKLNVVRSKQQQAVYNSVLKTEDDIVKGLKEIDEEWANDVLSKIEQKQTEYRSRILEARLNGGEDSAQKEQLRIAREVLDVAKEQLDDVYQLEAAYRELGYTDVEIQNMRLEARLKVQEAEKNIQNAQQRSAQEQIRQTQQALGVAAQAAGGFSAMFDALGGEGERYAEFSKALAVFEVALQQAQAIAGAVANAAKYSIPWLLPVQIASSIAAVVAAIAQATQVTDSAQTPKYASGGLVTGPGTGTSDSIPARLSNGEAVMTAQAVNDWGAMLSAMNVASGGNAISVSNLPQRNDGMRGIERMMERALMNMPAPIVSVVDINKGQKRVRVQNTLGKLGRKKYL